MNNKELINAGHALAKAISNDTPLIEIAKMVSNLATQLDVQLARSNALAAENAGLKAAKEIIRHLNINREEANFCGIDDCYIDDAVAAMITPDTHKMFQRERDRAEKAERRIAELEAREVKLPELCVGVVQGGHAVMVPYAAGHWFNKTAILEMLADAGINIAAAGKGE